LYGGLLLANASVVGCCTKVGGVSNIDFLTICYSMQDHLMIRLTLLIYMQYYKFNETGVFLGV